MPSSVTDDGWRYLFLAWLVALAAGLGALFVGEVMGQMPCNLCWFQRTAMFPLAIILAVACLRGDQGAVPYAGPFVLLGAAIAAFHSLLYAGWLPQAIEPCTRGGPSCAGPEMTILGGLPLPYLSLAAFASVAALLGLAHRTSTR